MREVMTVGEVALLLKLHPRTVMKMAAAGDIPSAKVGRKWRFERDTIEKWLASQMAGSRKETSGLVEATAAENLVEPRRVLIIDHAGSRREVLSKLADGVDHQSVGLSKEELLHLLNEREEMYPTAMESGIAFPHPRHPLPGLKSPVVVLATAPSGVPFGAPEGGLTYVFALVCSPDDRTHLRVLGQLARIFRSTETVERFRSCKMPAQVLETFRQCESLALSNQNNSIQYQ